MCARTARTITDYCADNRNGFSQSFRIRSFAVFRHDNVNATTFTNTPFVKPQDDFLDRPGNGVQVALSITGYFVVTLHDYVSVPIRPVKIAGSLRRLDRQNLVVFFHRAMLPVFFKSIFDSAATSAGLADADCSAGVLREVDAQAAIQSLNFSQYSGRTIGVSKARASRG